MTEEKLVVCAVILLAAICILGAGLFIFSMEQVDDEEAASFVKMPDGEVIEVEEDEPPDIEDRVIIFSKDGKVPPGNWDRIILIEDNGKKSPRLRESHE